MKNIILAILALCAFSSTGWGQASLPDDARKTYITVFTHEDWAKRPDEAQLIANLNSEPMKSVALKTHFNHYTPSVKMYQERWASIYPPETLPVIVFQNPDGAYIYKASQGNIPHSSADIREAMQYYFKLIPGNSREPEPIQQEEEPEGRKRPFHRDPIVDEEFPDSAEIFGGKTPIRDGIAGGVFTLQIVFAMAFLLAVLGFAAIFLSILNKVKP
mgnify:CR=1 FL=1